MSFLSRLALIRVGPIAPTVECCAIIDAVLAGDEPRPLDRISASDLRIGVLQGYVLEDLEAPVAQALCQCALDSFCRWREDAGLRVRGASADSGVES